MSAYDEAVERLKSHPASRALAACEAFRQTLFEVYGRNLDDLMDLLEAAAAPPLALELSQSGIASPVAAQVNQHLHNYLASSMSLVDHSRALVRLAAAEVRAAHAEGVAGLLDVPEVRLVQDLRNFLVHRRLPVLRHRLHLERSDADQLDVESELGLSIEDLLEWDGWTASSRSYLSALPDGQVDLRPVIDRHSLQIVPLNARLYEAVRRAVDTDAINELRIEANACLWRVPIDEARRRTMEGTG